MDNGEIFKKIISFKNKHKNDRRRLYVVRLDFTKCYDRINQDKLLEILEKVAIIYFTCTYFVVRGCMTRPTKRPMKTINCMALMTFFMTSLKPVYNFSSTHTK